MGKLQQVIVRTLVLVAAAVSISAATPSYVQVNPASGTQTGAFNVQGGTVTQKLSLPFLSTGAYVLTDAQGNLTTNGPSAAQYILNNSSLQPGSTAYPQYLYVGSSATIPTVNATTATVTYVNASSMTVTTATITALNNQIMRYRRPRLVYISGTEVDVESGTVSALNGFSAGGSSITVVFPDGSVYSSTGTEASQGVITSTANWGNGGLKGGMAPNENLTINTWEAGYLVKSSATADTTHMVVVISSFMPTSAANYNTLNSKFCGSGGANCWAYIGTFAFGTGGTDTTLRNTIVKFTMSGNRTVFTNSNSPDALVSTANGIILNQGTVSTNVTWTYAIGNALSVSGAQVPAQITMGDIRVVMLSSTKWAVGDAASSTTDTSLNGFTAGLQAGVLSNYPLPMGIKTAASGATSHDIWLRGYSDNILGIGSNPQL